MKHVVTAAIGLLIALPGLCAAQPATADLKEIVFEDRPVRSWLEDLRETGTTLHKAEEALRRFCAKPEKAVSALAAALTDEDALVRQAAARCLGYFLDKDGAARAIPPLLKALQEDKSTSVRTEAAAGLGHVGWQDKAALAALVKALKEDQAPEVRWKVIQTFRNNKPATVLPAVIAATKDKDARIRGVAFLALGEIGETKIVIPLLIDALTDDEAGTPKDRIGGPWDYDVKSWAGIALAKRCPDAIPAIRKALQDKNPIVRTGAMFALQNTKEEVWSLLRKEVPVLVPLLDDKDKNMRFYAANLLGKIKAVDAVPALAAKLCDADGPVRYQCIQALGLMGPDAAAAVEKLTKVFKDPDAELRCQTAIAFRRIGPKAKAAVPALIEALEDEDITVRREAAKALAAIGPDAKAAIPKLKEALNADDKELKDWAAIALYKIGTK